MGTIQFFELRPTQSLLHGKQVNSAPEKTISLY